MRHSITLCWVPGYKDIAGNEAADKLAKKGAEIDPSQAIDWTQPALADVRERVDDIILELAAARTLGCCGAISIVLKPTNSFNVARGY